MSLPTMAMIIKSLELKNFRNYERLSLSFSEQTNLFYGNNAQGKTNILEAIYLAATTKSHRMAKDRDMVYFEEEEAHIRLELEKHGVPTRLDLHLKKSKTKGIAVNGIPIRKASELFGYINVVLFSPEDLSMIKNGPSERRRFLDLELCQLDKLYLNALISYNKVLMQRNRLLKEIRFRPDLEETLDVWDLQLVRYGCEIMRIRKEFVENLNILIRPIHRQISANKEELTICYEANVDEEDYEEKIKYSRQVDIKNKVTLHGPHRDDLGFVIHDAGRAVDLKRFGSQGQQRTVALSLKLAELELVKNTSGDYPILLLDDVLSELDFGRQTHLIQSIRNIQTIITCTGLEDFENLNLPLHRVFRVQSGQVVIDRNKGEKYELGE